MEGPVIVLWLAACRKDPTPTAPTAETGDTGPTTTPTGTCAADATDDLGPDPFFDGWNGELAFRAVGGFASFEGAFQSGPDVRFQVESDRRGPCRLETYTPSTCTPACAGDQLCRESTCVDQPHRLDGGTLTLSGPTSDPLTLDPDGIGGYYAYTYDPIDDTAPLVLEGTAGPDIGAFTATTCPVGPANPDGDWAAALAARGDGEDVTLRWANPNPEARIRLRMTTGTATHGGIAHAEIACEGPDTGSLVLPGAFLDTLYAEGWACGECGGNDLVRYRAAAVGDTGTAFVSEAVTSFFHIP